MAHRKWVVASKQSKLAHILYKCVLISNRVSVTPDMSTLKPGKRDVPNRNLGNAFNMER
jgi:hypothetical protein